jgi:AraC-like DNA-binding protein
VIQPEAASPPCYSARIVKPYVRVLRRYPGFPLELLAPLEALDPDERLPIAALQELQRGALLLTGDPDLGLKAAREISPGDYGALEYAVRSAPTWRDGVGLVARYMRLINDALDFSLHTEAERAIIHLDSSVPLERCGIDFQSAAFHISGSYFRPSGSLSPDFEVWFTHARPASTDEYERTFAECTIRFDAPFNGFVFPTHYLARQMQGADPQLHALIRKHAEALLSELPRAQNVTEKVRQMIANELEGGNPGAANVAKHLHMSPRTLGRKLEQEGTTFTALLDDLRRRLALRYVGGYDLGLSEIAFLLGFSQSAAFHRAFKRWTAQTPLEYRRARRAQVRTL